MACAPSEDSDQPGHLPSPIRVFAVRMKKAWILSYPHHAQVDLTLPLEHRPFCWFCHEMVLVHLVFPVLVVVMCIMPSIQHTKTKPGLQTEVQNKF